MNKYVSNFRKSTLFSGIALAMLLSLTMFQCNLAVNEIDDENTYLITTEDELLAMRTNSVAGAKYLLMNDLDLTGYTIMETTTANVFSGKFYGNNNTIKNFKSVSGAVLDNFGLFQVASGAEVYDLIFEGVEILNSAKGSQKIGTIFGSVIGGSLISNVTVEGTISGEAKTSVGGVVGSSENNLTMNDVYSKVNIRVDASQVGGLVGDVSTTGTLTINKSYAKPASGLVAVNNMTNFGGLIGRTKQPFSIINSYFESFISSKGENTGGLVGIVNIATGQGQVIASYVKGGITNMENQPYLGGLVGRFVCNTVTCSISQSYAEVEIVAGGSYAGGLIGYMEGSGMEVSDSYSSGSVSGYSAKATFLGGLVGGINQGKIQSSYTSMLISGFEATTIRGGLVGAIARPNTYIEGYADNRNYSSATYPPGDVLGVNAVTTGTTALVNGLQCATDSSRNSCDGTSVFIGWSNSTWNFGDNVTYPTLNNIISF